MVVLGLVVAPFGCSTPPTAPPLVT